MPIATLEPYVYDMGGGLDKNNIKLFGDISKAFCSLFAPSGEVKLNIEGIENGDIDTRGARKESV